MNVNVNTFGNACGVFHLVFIVVPPILPEARNLLAEARNRTAKWTYSQFAKPSTTPHQKCGAPSSVKTHRYSGFAPRVTLSP